MVTGIFDEPLEGYKGPTGCCIMSQEFYETDRVARLRARLLVRDPARLRPGVHRAVGHVGGDACPGARTTTAPTPSSSTAPRAWSSICEDLPEESNRVTLDPDLTDADGIPAPKITYRLSENSSKMLAHGVARGEGGAAGGGRAATPSPRRRCRSPAGT